MPDATPAVPTKTTEMHNMAMDSTRWDGFAFRDDDIVVGTWAKSGTTWVQQIVAQLIFEGEEKPGAMDLAPWVDMRVLPLDEIVAGLESQTHRRFMKTHLPADALVFSPKAKYIYVGRDGRDVVWSWHNHLRLMTAEFYDMINDCPGRVGPPAERPTADVREFFHDWLDNNAYPWWPFWSNIQSWWDVRQYPNVQLLHFNNLKKDMPGEIRRIAAFLGIAIDEAKWPAIVEHSSFDYMKANADSLSAVFKDFFEGGLTNFIHKGTNNRWRDTLNADEIQKYEETAAKHLSPDCARWLATGEGL